MASPSNILNIPLYNFKTNPKIFFDDSIDIETIDHNIFNKYTIYKYK